MSRPFEAQRAVEVVEAQALRIPGALHVGAGVGGDEADVVDRLARVHMPAVRNLRVGLALHRSPVRFHIPVLDLELVDHTAAPWSGEADGRADDRLVGSEWRQVARVDDAEVVVGAVGDDRAADDLDALHALDRRPVVHRRVEPQGQVDGVAVLHDQHLARAPRRRAAQADAAMMGVAVVVDDDDAGHARQRLVDGVRLALGDVLGRDVRRRAGEALQVGRNELARIDRCDGALVGALGRPAAGRGAIDGVGVDGRRRGRAATAAGCGAGETDFFFAADFFLAAGAGAGCFWITSTGGS